MTTLHAVDIDESWLDDMYTWLTDPHVNDMARVGSLTREGQAKWLAGLPGRDDYWIRGIHADGVRVGAFGLKKINEYGAEVFSYIGPSVARGAGIGQWTMRQCDDEAARRGIPRLWGIVGLHNKVSINMLRRSGYVALGAHEDWGLFIEKLVPGRESTQL